MSELKIPKADLRGDIPHVAFQTLLADATLSTTAKYFSLKDACRLWLLQLIRRLKYLDKTKQIYLYRQCVDTCVQYMDYLDQALVIIRDGRYAAWTGKQGLIDLVTGEDCEDNIPRALESTSYDICELYRRNMEKLHAIQSTNQESTD